MDTRSLDYSSCREINHGATGRGLERVAVFFGSMRGFKNAQAALTGSGCVCIRCRKHVENEVQVSSVFCGRCHHSVILPSWLSWVRAGPWSVAFWKWA